MTINKIYIKRTAQVIFAVAVLWFLYSLTKDWLRPKIIKSLGGYTAVEYTEKIDTLQSVYDTLYFDYKELETKVSFIPEPKVITNYRVEYLPSTSIKGKGEETNKTPSLENALTYGKVNEYNIPISDSLINGSIFTVINTDNCKIIDQKLNYKPKFPIIVKETVTIEKTKTETLYDKPKAKLGIGLIGSSDYDIGATAVYQLPTNWQFQLGYIKPKKESDPLIKNQEGKIQVSIIKLF